MGKAASISFGCATRMQASQGAENIALGEVEPKFTQPSTPVAPRTRKECSKNHGTLKLSEVPRRLKAEFDVSVSYRRLYRAVLDGIVPASKDASGARWLVNVTDLLLIANWLAPK